MLGPRRVPDFFPLEKKTGPILFHHWGECAEGTEGGKITDLSDT